MDCQTLHSRECFLIESDEGAVVAGGLQRRGRQLARRCWTTLHAGGGEHAVGGRDDSSLDSTTDRDHGVTNLEDALYRAQSGRPHLRLRGI